MEEIKLTKEDWEDAKKQNINLIKSNIQQIAMAERILTMCDEKIAEFKDG